MGGRHRGAASKALELRGLPYQVDPGEGVFYGPKIDIKIKDSLDRAWQCSTIQVDFHNPNRFELEYIGEDGKAHQPVMVHRALLGSLERFFGVLDRALRGRVPAVAGAGAGGRDPGGRARTTSTRARWPATLRGRACACSVDDRSEKLGYKIREAQVQKIPYMLVVGDKEVEARHRVGAPPPGGRPGLADAATRWRRQDRPPRGRARDVEEASRRCTRRCLIDQKTVRINDRIRAKEVRVIDDDGAQLGIMPPAAGPDRSPRRRASTWSRSRPPPPRPSAGS